jgi:hypothetical protein
LSDAFALIVKRFANSEMRGYPSFRTINPFLPK